MPNTSNRPRPDDIIVGSQSLIPIEGAVLGGIDDLRQRLVTDNIEEKKVTLTQALNYGKQGVEVLFEVLRNEPKQVLRYTAYCLLKENENNLNQEQLKEISKSPQAKLYLIRGIYSQGGQGRNLSKVDLSWAALSGVNLREANLSGANLSFAQLGVCEWFNLKGQTGFDRTDLRNANLSEANLTGANLSGADLSGADLSNANLSGAFLNEAKLKGSNLQGADFRGADLSSADLSDANLSDTNFSSANLSGQNLDSLILRGAYFDNSNKNKYELDVDFEELSYYDYLNYGDWLYDDCGHLVLPRWL